MKLPDPPAADGARNGPTFSPQPVPTHSVLSKDRTFPPLWDEVSTAADAPRLPCRKIPPALPNRAPNSETNAPASLLPPLCRWCMLYVDVSTLNNQNSDTSKHNEDFLVDVETNTTPTETITSSQYKCPQIQQKTTASYKPLQYYVPNRAAHTQRKTL
jgi:hypothetical protein